MPHSQYLNNYLHENRPDFLVFFNKFLTNNWRQKIVFLLCSVLFFCRILSLWSLCFLFYSFPESCPRLLVYPILLWNPVHCHLSPVFCVFLPNHFLIVFTVIKSTWYVLDNNRDRINSERFHYFICIKIKSQERFSVFIIHILSVFNYQLLSAMYSCKKGTEHFWVSQV